MTDFFHPGQTFRMTNPDYNTYAEVWTVDEVGPEQISFSRWRSWVRDIAYIEPESTEPFVGKVLKVVADGVIVVEARLTRYNEGFHFKADEMSHMSGKSVEWYLKPEKSD